MCEIGQHKMSAHCTKVPCIVISLICCMMLRYSLENVYSRAFIYIHLWRRSCLLYLFAR